MKSWAVLLLVAVAVWFGYRQWIAPEDGEVESGVDGVPGMVVAETQAAAGGEAGTPEPASAGDRPERGGIDLDLPDAHAAEGPSVPSGPPVDEKAWELRRQLEAAVAGERADEVQALKQRILKEHPDSDPARLLLFDEGRAWYQRFRKLGRTEEGLLAAREARRLMTPALFLARAEEAEKDRLRQALRDCSDAVLFGRRPVDGVLRPHTPQRGDTLGGLRAKVFKPQWGAEATPDFIAEVSGLRGPEAMRAGGAVLVPVGKVEIVVVKSEFRLYFLIDGAYVRDYSVGLGRLSSTPEGVFVIESKIVNPDWWSPEGRKIPYGDPNNILGSRWMGFANTTQYSGFGIHGTTDPASIGREESSGCVRMLRADVEQLFSWTPHGARVEIRR